MTVTTFKDAFRQARYDAGYRTYTVTATLDTAGGLPQRYREISALTAEEAIDRYLTSWALERVEQSSGLDAIIGHATRLGKPLILRVPRGYVIQAKDTQPPITSKRREKYEPAEDMAARSI